MHNTQTSSLNLPPADKRKLQPPSANQLKQETFLTYTNIGGDSSKRSSAFASVHIQHSSDKNNNSQEFLLDQLKNDLSFTIKDLDKKLHKVVAKQEKDYLQGYNMFMLKKERELREIIDKLNQKNANRSFKDEKILQLEVVVKRMREDAFKCEDINMKNSDEIQKLKNKIEILQGDRRFLYQHAKEEKQKSLNLKKKVTALLEEISDLKSKLKIQQQDDLKSKLAQIREQSFGEELSTSRRMYSMTLNSSKKRDASLSQDDYGQFGSMYCPYTQNKKFELFLNDLYDLNLDVDKNKKEIVNYVQVIESFYTNKLHKIKARYEKKLKELKKKHNDQINPKLERSELEKVFLNALDEMRKQILKRRLRQEIELKSKANLSDKKALIDDTQEAREFEESILKLVNFAKGRVQYEEFTTIDKYHLMELFVTNETTLLYVFQSLFPVTAKFIQPREESQNKVKINIDNESQFLNDISSKNDLYFITETLDEQKEPVNDYLPDKSVDNIREQQSKLSSLQHSTKLEYDKSPSQINGLNHLPKINIGKIGAYRSKSTIKGINYSGLVGGYTVKVSSRNHNYVPPSLRTQDISQSTIGSSTRMIQPPSVGNLTKIISMKHDPNLSIQHYGSRNLDISQNTESNNVSSRDLKLTKKSIILKDKDRLNHSNLE